jgi:uncharacterized membrane protein YvbJ
LVEINNPCPKCGQQTSLDQKFCNKCGNKVETDKSTQFCGECGTEVSYPQNICSNCGIKVNLSSFQYKEPKRATTKKWYLFPIIFGIFGGVTAWALLRESDNKMAMNCLLVGIGFSIFHIILVLIGISTSESSGSFQTEWGE